MGPTIPGGVILNLLGVEGKTTTSPARAEAENPVVPGRVYVISVGCLSRKAYDCLSSHEMTHIFRHRTVVVVGEDVQQAFETNGMPAPAGGVIALPEGAREVIVLGCSDPDAFLLNTHCLIQVRFYSNAKEWRESEDYPLVLPPL